MQAPKIVNDLVERIGKAKELDGIVEKVSGWVAAVTKAAPVKNALSGSWLGHQLHPVLTDLPIGAWGAATALDLLGGEDSAEASRKLVGLGLVASAPTALAGAADWSDTYGPDKRVGLVHAATNGTASVLQAASWLARRRGHRGVGVALSLVAVSVTLASAYLGGHLSYVKGIGVNHTAFQKTTRKWNDVAADDEIREGELNRVTVGDTPLLLVRQRGELHALSATCTHAGGPLDEGKLDPSGCVTCPWHGSRFRLDDGSVDRGPASVPQPRWEVRVDDGRVLVRAA
ncbi:hypothetical protein GCM10017576_17710 [Microbacterium barkeri]|uniref:Rieske domain-containing protein n=1 Tax=Microbacterium barkeri TaxID=33917 RepID=A0A9W6H3E6_9MICO|nr:Rieske 2Fe-2S domain-containing protein [Microbacterium barkeri]MDR6875510.1 nitrite reductase/ring-hydroxylating ferredoxin subunit/uncharacterized membrane protein [Microbacterium barkeri]GLJ61641.1 hypothetical protein GCM10017576_17710 [Microbacterium barkeri]